MDDNEPILTDRKATLERMSVEELQKYMAELVAEMDKCRAEIAKKEAQKSAADALFKNN